MTEKLNFPEALYVAHYEHSTNETPSLSACLTEKEAIESASEQPVYVAEYKLVRTRLLSFQIREEPF